MTEPTALTRAAPLRASTWNAETFTVLAVLSTGAAVTRHDARGAFEEVLDVNQPWPASIPLLDSHSRGSVDDRLGEVIDIKTVGTEVIGTVKLSRHNERAKRVAAELTDGATYAVSIGYSVKKWAETKTNGKRTLTAVSFDLLEASLTTVPADQGAGLRSTPPLTTTTTTPAQTRAQLASEVRSIAKTAGLDQAWIDAQTDADDIDLASVREAALAALASRSAAAAQVRAPHNDQTLDDPEVRARAMGESLFARANPTHTPTDQARAFVGMTTLDLARESLRHAGISTTGMQPASVIERAYMGTTDFPLAFADSVGRQLAQAYKAAPSGVRQLARQSTVRDFRAKSTISIANKIELKKVNEHGEFKSTSLVESQESYKIDTFGAIIGVTRQMLINDDIGAFADISARLGQAAAAFEAQFLVDRITANPAMADTKTLFHADHGNLAGSAAAISEASVSAARLALRKQTDAGSNLISITPAYLLVGPEIETAAEKFLASITPAKTDDTNVFSGKLTLVVEPRLTGKQWYISASPAEVPSLEYSYLAGEPGPVVSQEVGFDVDGLRFRVREDFGAGWLDHRGWFKNAGA